MNAQEAREALEAGKKIRHPFWTKTEYVYFKDIENDLLFDESGAKTSIYFDGFDTWELYEEPKITLREGGTYVARDGRKTRKVVRSSVENAFFIEFQDGTYLYYYKDGSHYTMSSDNDIIQEITEAKPAPLKLEVGKTYIDNKGEKEKITHCIKGFGTFCFRGKSGKYYASNGYTDKAVFDDKALHLVAEYKEPVAEAPKPVLEEGKKQNFLGKETFACDNGYKVDASDQINEVNKRLSQTYQPKPVVMREGAYYKTRDGRITDGDLERRESDSFLGYPWVTTINGEVYSYNNEGRHTIAFECNHDLVEEVPAPVKPENLTESHTKASDAINTSDIKTVFDPIGCMQAQLNDMQQQINKLSYASGLTAGKLDKHLSESEPETGDFAFALKLMQKGKKVRRKRWLNESFRIYRGKQTDDPIFCARDKYPVNYYNYTLSDFTATDWEEYKKEGK